MVNKNKAFTLVEAIAAMVIMGIVLGVALRMITLGNKAEAQNQIQMTAYLLLQRKLEEVTALAFTSNVSAVNQSFPETELSTYRYSVSEYSNFSGCPDLKKITVSIQWPSPSLTHAVSVSTVVSQRP